MKRGVIILVIVPRGVLEAIPEQGIAFGAGHGAKCEMTQDGLGRRRGAQARIVRETQMTQVTRDEKQDQVLEHDLAALQIGAMGRGAPD